MAASAAQAVEPRSGVRAALTRRDWATFGAMGAVVLGLHVLGWGIFAILVLPGHFKAVGVGVAVLAYTLGNRHAFDADHISAIDNTTRKLLAEGKRPLSVGLFFSLGHSTIVVVVGIGLTVAAKAVFGQVRAPNSLLHSFGGVFGTLVSGCFLLLIATLNLVVLAGILRVFQEMRRGSFSEAELEAQLNNRGLMFRFLGPLMRTITQSWQMYPVGVLFGLGFDTATEVALLAATAGAAATGLPWYAVLMLPILFTAGMSILDTADGAFMNFAYSWAFARPIRKVYYNIVVTGLSVAVALFVGLIELLGLLGTELNLSGGLWGFLGNFDINKAGFVIVGLFIVTWTVAFSVWHFGKIERRWSRAVIS